MFPFSISQALIRFCIGFALVFFGASVYAQVLQERTTGLQGRIVNYNPAADNKSFLLLFRPLEDQMARQVVNINTDGTFKFKTGIAYAQEVTLLYRNYRYPLLFNPGDSLNLTIDTTVAAVGNQKLLDDQKRYQSLIDEMEDPQKLKIYDMNDRSIISGRHSDFVSQLYRKVTSDFSPDSAILFKKAAGDRDIISLAKLIMWNIQHKTTGFTRDVFFTRLFLDALNGYQLKEFDALWDEKLIAEPWFKSKIRMKREEIMRYLANQKTEATLITDTQLTGFENVIKKYAGKVIYVDFWAPWCSPCMAAMPASKLVQEHFKDEDVVFLFLANRCSEESWKATIANKGLGGIHLKLTDDEYNVLAERFKIVGIPHYLMIDKQGKVVSPDAPGPDSPKTLIADLEKLVGVKVR
ncbi:TlpA disulfide reductase family protein [Pedobacter frigoris]|uniref:TlpA family protein disulfide reductase n=1 Tax=Pedobacter frigoris TaxID=2571272 RepID=UPI00292DEB01|nr:TlpA disulfide reductase family protein [Pedobacter frigoris]